MKNIKQEKGITGIDIAISLGIISITLAILGALYFNLYISSTQIERKTEAINFATQILEKMDSYYYSEVTSETFAVTQKANGKNEVVGLEIPRGYNVTVQITKYPSGEGIDVVKQVSVTIAYNVGEKGHTIVLRKSKEKEKFAIPNIPKLEANMIPVKVVKNGDSKTYKQTTAQDEQWYNYNQKRWALAVLNAVGDTIKIQDLYVWIPRYAYNSSDNTDVKFLYSNTNKIVNLNGDLEEVASGYLVNGEFSTNNGYWAKISEMNLDSVATLLNNSTYGPLDY